MDGVKNGFSLHIEPPSYVKIYEKISNGGLEVSLSIYARRFYNDHLYVSVSRFGRKTAFMLSFILHLGGGFGSAFAPNYGTFVACRFITGMSNMGMFMSTFVIGKSSLFLRTNIHSTAWRKRKLKKLHEDIACCIVTRTNECRCLINTVFNEK